MSNNLKDVFKKSIFVGIFILPIIPFLVWSELFFPYITTKAFAWRFIVEILFFVWLVLAICFEEYRPKKSPIVYAVAIFLVVIGLANILGSNPSRSFWSNFERMEGYIALIHLGMFFLVMSTVMREKHWTWWWNTNLVVAGSMAVYGLLEVGKGEWRVDASFGNPSYLAGYMLFNIFLALLMGWRARRSRVLLWVYLALVVLLTTTLYFTATRGAILGLIGGFVVFSLLNVRNSSKKVRNTSFGILAVVVLVVGGFWVARNSAFVQENAVLVRFANISTEELKGGGRSYVWPIAVEGFKKNPIFGWGQDNFIYVFSEHYKVEMYSLEPWFDRAHNIFLDWLIAGGILGLLAYLSLYVALVFSVWKRDVALGQTEKALITSLVCVYFFHNIFVFDNLVSYMLFFALLAYVHSRTSSALVWSGNKENSFGPVLAVSLLLLLCTVYFVNIKPLNANTSILKAVKSIQQGNASLASGYFREAYESSYLGRAETVEQISTNAVSVLESELSVAEKNEFFAFASEALRKEADNNYLDPRYSLAAASFFSRTGQFDEAGKYFTKAKEVIPQKLEIYFEEGVLLLNQEKPQEALEKFREAYELAPDQRNAQVLYLAGAIYANSRELESRLINEFSEDVFYDDKIAAAYLENGRYEEAIDIYSYRVTSSPSNPQEYINLAVVYMQAGQRNNAVEVLKILGEKIPEYKNQSEKFIEQIQNEEI